MANVPTVTEQKKIAREMRAKGARYFEISAALFKRGVTTTKSKGRAPSPGYAHALLNGHKKKPTATKRAYNKGGALLSSATKYDLLRTIEACADLNGDTRKALLQLVLQEFYK